MQDKSISKRLNNSKNFKALLDAHDNGFSKIVQLIVDTFIVLNDLEELEIVLKNIINKYSLANELMPPTEVFAIPDNSKEFDPVASYYVAVLLYKIAPDFNILVRFNLQVDRAEEIVFVSKITTGKIKKNKTWQIFKEDVKQEQVSFKNIKLLRKYKLKVVNERINK